MFMPLEKVRWGLGLMFLIPWEMSGFMIISGPLLQTPQMVGSPLEYKDPSQGTS